MLHSHKRTYATFSLMGFITNGFPDQTNWSKQNRLMLTHDKTTNMSLLWSSLLLPITTNFSDEYRQSFSRIQHLLPSTILVFSNLRWKISLNANQWKCKKAGSPSVSLSWHLMAKLMATLINKAWTWQETDLFLEYHLIEIFGFTNIHPTPRPGTHQ